MKMTLRLSAMALFSCTLVGACSSSNDPAVNSNDTDGDSSGTDSGGTGSNASGETSGTDASSNGTGGASSSSETDTTSGTDGSAGETGAEDFRPACELTLSAAGEEIKKGTACTDEDPQLCWRTCGPQSSGWKSETCMARVYAEGDCVFPSDQTYECYAIPDEVPAECPTTTEEMPKASAECDVPECTLCNVENQYLTSSGEVKVGYCVCQPPNSAGTRSWSCSSGTAWPCPLGQGC
jgi:hypothetical protein